MQEEQDEVLDKAVDAGLANTDLMREKIVGMMATYGKDKVLYAIGEAAAHCTGGCPNIAYIEAVCKGKGKQKQNRDRIHDDSEYDY